MGLLGVHQVICVSTRYRVYGRQHIVCVARLFSSYRNLVGNRTPVVNRRDGWSDVFLAATTLEAGEMFDVVRLRYRLSSVRVATPEKGYFRCAKELVCFLVEDGC